MLTRGRKRQAEFQLTKDETLKVRRRVVHTLALEDDVIEDIFSSFKDYEPTFLEETSEPLEKGSFNDYISATAVRNYILNDPLIDWLEMYYRYLGFNERFTKDERILENRKSLKNASQAKIIQDISFVTENKKKYSTLFQKGYDFEKSVAEYLSDKDFKQICYTHTDLTLEKMEECVKEMRRGRKIIFQAPLFNQNNHTKGIADLLIRSDCINDIFTEKVLTEDEVRISSVFGKYHYLVVDIKFSHLPLCFDGKRIRNDKRFPANKAQLLIYNCALGFLQGYFPTKSFILGKSFDYSFTFSKEVPTKRIVKSSHDAFERLGVVDFMEFDKPIIEKTIDGIRWIRDLRVNGMNWSIVPVSRRELKPNMGIEGQGWDLIKGEIARKTNELTQIWMVGSKNRDIAEFSGVSRGMMSRNLTAKKLGITGKRIAPIVDSIIRVNRSKKDKIIFPIKKKNIVNYTSIRPSKKNSKIKEIFVDFETLSEDLVTRIDDCRNTKCKQTIIFMIGVGWEEDGEWKFKQFSLENPSLLSEEKVLDNFFGFLNDRFFPERELRVWHYSSAEISNMKTVNLRFGGKWNDTFNKLKWVDLYSTFSKSPIVVKGSLKFRLKDISKAMYSHGMIQTLWEDSGPINGFSATVDAVAHYYSEKDEEKFDAVKKYNEVDCRVMWEILKYLRSIL